MYQIFNLGLKELCENIFMDCPVCLSSLGNRRLRVLNSPCCNQNIHKRCIIRWLKSNDTCPLCREKLLTVPYATNYFNLGNYCSRKILSRLIFMCFILAIFITIGIFTDYTTLISVTFSIVILVLLIIMCNCSMNMFLNQNHWLNNDEPIICTCSKMTIIHVPQL